MSAETRPAALDESFLPWQVDLLKQPVPKSLLRRRNQGGKELAYIAGHDAIAMANRVFGVSNWSYTTASVWCVGAVYHALVTLQVHTPSGQIVERGDLGTCDIQGYVDGKTPNLNAVQQAAKGCVTDGLKRCLRTFGDLFGNSLYDEDGPRPAAEPARDDPKAAPGDDDDEPAHPCPTCDAPMVYREGTTKAGKPYRAWFCSDRECSQKPIWLAEGKAR